MRRIDATTLKAWIHDGAELAILDAREDGEFGTGHLFWANPCGLARAELRAPLLLPRPGVRICCVDAGDGLAERLAGVLAGLGYTDLSVLEGGTAAWVAAGYVLFSGVNVPSKAFGEWVEHHYHTPSVSAEELKAMADAGADMVILDSRPLAEFQRMSIPGGICVPGGELLYRAGDLAPNPATTIVVNCAGRTRSIMGAESLRSGGVPNKVVALRNGTMGWELAGFECARGEARSYDDGAPQTLEVAMARAEAFAAQHGVRTIDRAGLAAMLADASRTTHVLDVRSPLEYAEAHLAGSRSAPGGQLVQATDQWIATRHARIVLVDDTGVRARMAGGWLHQLGQWEVFVLTDAFEGHLEDGIPRVHCPAADAIQASSVTAPELYALLADGGAQLVDLARSVEYRAGHIPGAIWGVRTRLAALAARLRPDMPVVVAADPPALARLAVPELRGLVNAPVRILAGGNAAWRDAGFPLRADKGSPPDADCIDFYLRPYDRNSGIEAAMHAYLSWEIDLVHEVARDGDARFGQV